MKNRDNDKRDHVERFVPLACCIVLMLSVATVGLIIYGIYKLILMLL